jgi:hypothetical protein
MQSYDELKQQIEYYGDKVQESLSIHDEAGAELWRIKRREIDKILKTMPKKLTEADKKRMREYYQANKVELAEYSKQYIQKNKDRINERNKEKVQCENCKCMVNKKTMWAHVKRAQCISLGKTEVATTDDPKQVVCNKVCCWKGIRSHQRTNACMTAQATKLQSS